MQLRLSGHELGLALAILLVSSGMAVCADEPEAFTPSAEFQELITGIVRESLPHEYEKKHNWGNTQRVFDGLKWERDGIRLEAHRRWKEANDGQWQMYRVRLIEPEQTFRVQVEKIQSLENGKVQCDLAVLARMEVYGQIKQWERGMQLISLSSEAETSARLTARVEVGGRVDAKQFPPSLYLEPVVKDARVELRDFRIKRISHFDGPLAKSLSRSVREIVDDKLEDMRPKLVDKMNEQIGKNQEKLKLSVADLLKSPWGKSLEPAVKTAAP